MTAASVTKRLGLMTIAYLTVIGLYISFFAYPVSLATPADMFSFEIQESTYSRIPHIQEAVYTDGTAFMAVATIRTISTPNSAYSAAFQRLDKYAEDFVRENYYIDVDIVVESEDESFEIGGHTGMKFVYGIYKELAIGIPPFVTYEDVRLAELGAIAWFCNIDFESNLVFYVSPDFVEGDESVTELASNISDMVGSIECH